MTDSLEQIRARIVAGGTTAYGDTSTASALLASINARVRSDQNLQDLPDKALAFARLRNAALVPTVVDDVDYTALPTDVKIRYRNLTAARRVTLPTTFPVSQDLLIADYSKNCSPSRPILITPANNAVTISGQPGFLLTSPYQSLVLSRDTFGVWSVVSGAATPWDGSAYQSSQGVTAVPLTSILVPVLTAADNEKTFVLKAQNSQLAVKEYVASGSSDPFGDVGDVGAYFTSLIAGA